MSQSQKPTTQGYGEIGKLIAGETASAVTNVVAYSGTCTTAAEASTYASPAATMMTTNGFAQVAAATVISSQTTVANDTVELDHVFTASGVETVTGFAALNDDGDVLFAECCFDSGLAVQNADTLTCEMKMHFELGS